MLQASFCGPNPRVTRLGASPSVTEMLQARVWDRSHPKVTPTSRKVPVTTAASGKIVWQAGMSKRTSDVRGYVPLQVTKSPDYLRPSKEQPEKSEKHSWQAGMYPGMNKLAGYMACRDRDNQDF
jgi:hypothetical protein